MTATGHVYTVEFRIFSDSLDPNEITRELSLKPCEVRRPGTLRADGRVLMGLWAYNGGDAEGQHVEYPALQEGVVSLLTELWPKRNIVAEYAKKADLIWWCGNFQTSFDGGPRFTPDLLKQLGEFGASLFIDNYFHTPPY